MKAYTGRELVRLLRHHGWEVERIEGSHYILGHLGREEVISVPVHAGRTLKAGLVHGILRTAGIRIED